MDHLYPVWLLIVNHPKLLPNISEFSEYKVKFENQIRNCEDIVLDEKRGAAILSCDPGRDWWNTVMVSHSMIIEDFSAPDTET